MGIDVTRLAGSTRYDTSTALAQASVAAGLDPSEVWLATGRGLARAHLVGGPDVLSPAIAATLDRPR